jgi:uncharacterized coiled-coil protein SlyX
MDDRQRQLEEALAHQQHLVDLLNEAVTSQQQNLLSLERRVITLEQRYLELLRRVGDDDMPQERPPHY